MSHASVIVALSPSDLEKHANNVEAAIAYQMEPFDENGEWFREGSRWDWWQIGGRFTGKLDPGYDPEDDPENWETCFICRGAGRRADAVGQEARQRDPDYTCNGCQGQGRSLKWPTAWKNFTGDVKLRRDLDEATLRAGQEKQARKLWAKWLAEKDKSDTRREWSYGFKPDESLESLLARYTSRSLQAYAFLKERAWYEQSRLGWFGASTATECERRSLAETGEEYTGRCLHTCPHTGARIVSFQEEDDERWPQLYWPRFIRPLLPETTLVIVDYHV